MKKVFSVTMVLFAVMFFGACSFESKDAEDVGQVNDANVQPDSGVAVPDAGNAVCKNGETKECGINVGECKFGKQTCAKGVWGNCTGAVGPTIELCDGLDNNCNGQTDEDLISTCGTSEIGECRHGFKTCHTGVWGLCEGEVRPVGEVCDGLDNNCDGTTDEGCECTPETTRSCGTIDVGECKFGVQTCENGHWGTCVGAVEPKAELCDGLDNDCNGQVDEGLTLVCGSNVGECKQGTRTCSNGVWGECLGAVGPTSEVCDGKDNNCDGVTDEGLTQKCGSDIGECKSGTQKCENGVWGACNDAVWAKEEVCDNKDNNCDGTTDEGCECASGKTRECGSSLGECKSGVQTCENSVWGACKDAVGPKPELCDGKDNNCDGQVDEGLTLVCGSSVGECKTGFRTCSNGVWSEECKGSTDSTYDICDNKDNNCDGQRDEWFTQKGLPCSVGIGACKREGIYVCRADGWDVECSAVAGTPTAEVCDGLDNDCDGAVDESNGDCTPEQTCTAGKCVDHKYSVTCAVPQSMAGVGRYCEPRFYYGGYINGEKVDIGYQPHQLEIAIDKATMCGSWWYPKAEFNAQVYGPGLPADGTWVGGATVKLIGLTGQMILLTEVTRGTPHNWAVPNPMPSCPVEACVPTPEVCDGKDNDCDNIVDEGCQCIPNTTRTCGTDVGECTAGLQTCGQNGLWSDCVGMVPPSQEICDGKDNDCDGVTDEGYELVGTWCSVGTGTCRRDGFFVCTPTGGLDCNVVPGTPTAEVCDGLDNDCDGHTDEATNPLCMDGQICNLNGQCVCPAGSTTCNATCTYLDTDKNNCGACGNVCASGKSCVGGQCVTAGVCQDGKDRIVVTAPVTMKPESKWRAYECEDHTKILGEGTGAVTEVTFYADSTKSCFMVDWDVNGDGKMVYGDGDRWTCNWWQEAGRIDGTVKAYHCVGGYEETVMTVSAGFNGTGGACYKN